MAGGFSILDNLNKNSKQNINDAAKACFRTKNIPISNIRRNDKNFYEMKDIEKLADEIQMVGLLENLTVVYSPDEASKTEYKLIGGERRLQALNLLVKRGFKEFNTVTCNVRSEGSIEEEMIDIIICNSQRKKSTYELLEEEKNLKDALTNLKKSKGTIKGVDISKGRLRDIIADMLSLSSTKVAQIERINNNLIDSFKEELKKELITFSVAYEIAGLDASDQYKAYEIYNKNSEISLNDVRKIKDKKELEKSINETIKVRSDEFAENLNGQVKVEEALDNISYYDRQNNYLSLGISFFDYIRISNLIRNAQEDTIFYLKDTFEIDVDISKFENEETKIKETNRILDELYISLKKLDKGIQMHVINTFLSFYKKEKETIKTDKQIESEDIKDNLEDFVDEKYYVSVDLSSGEDSTSIGEKDLDVQNFKDLLKIWNVDIDMLTRFLTTPSSDIISFMKTKGIKIYDNEGQKREVNSILKDLSSGRSLESQNFIVNKIIKLGNESIKNSEVESYDTDVQKEIEEDFKEVSNIENNEPTKEKQYIESPYKNIELLPEEELEQMSEEYKNQIADKFINELNLETDLRVEKIQVMNLIDGFRKQLTDPKYKNENIFRKDVVRDLNISLYDDDKYRKVEDILNDLIEILKKQKEYKKWGYICRLLGAMKYVPGYLYQGDITPKQTMLNRFHYAKLNHYDYIGVAISKKGMKGLEVIINPHVNIDEKVNYYKEAYDEDLVLKNCKDIKIVNVSYNQDAAKLINILLESE